jgi:predicted porin
MKKTLIALAAVAAAGAASAQSSVTLFGIVDASISRYVVDQNNGLANGQGSNNTVMSNSGYNSSRLGFRGTEDLGGGLSASFWLEGQLQNDNGNASANNGGALTFQRRSTVSLAGANWGEVRLGRDYVPTFWNLTVFDPFGTVGVGANLAHKWRLYAPSFNAAGTALTGGGTSSWDPNYVRANNMIGYFLPANLGGFYGQAGFAFDETAQNSVNGSSNKAGRYWGARLGYGSGPFNVALAYGHTDGSPNKGLGTAALGGAGSTPDVSDWNLGGQWDFGVARLMGTYDHTKYDAGGFGNATLKSWMIGGIVPVGAGEIKASYGHTVFDIGGGDPTTSQIAIGYVHNLSKRTALYTTYARLNNSNGATVPVNASLSQGPAPAGNSGIIGQPNVHSWGFDVGVRHSF